MPTVMTFTSLQTDIRDYIERGFTAASDPIVYSQIPRLINNAERELAQELKVQGFINNLVDYFTVGVSVYDKPDRWRQWISINWGDTDVYATTQRQNVAGMRTLTLDRPHPFAVGDSIIVSGLSDSNYNTGSGAVVVTTVSQLTVTYFQGAGTDGPTADTGGLVGNSTFKRRELKPRVYEYCRNYWPTESETGDPEFYADYDYYHFIVAPTPRRPSPFEINFYQLPPLLDDTNQTNWLTDIAPTLLLHKTLLLAVPFLKNPEMAQEVQNLYAQAAQAITGQDLDKIHDRTSDRSKP